MLILLSDIDGLYDGDPRKHPDANLISEVKEITPEIEAMAEGKGTALGTGGMETKIHAAKTVTEKGIDMVIINSNNPEALYDTVEGKPVGTKFYGKGK